MSTAKEKILNRQLKLSIAFEKPFTDEMSLENLREKFSAYGFLPNEKGLITEALNFALRQGLNTVGDLRQTDLKAFREINGVGREIVELLDTLRR